MKHPIRQMSDAKAKEACEEFVADTQVTGVSPGATTYQGTISLT